MTRREWLALAASGAVCGDWTGLPQSALAEGVAASQACFQLDGVVQCTAGFPDTPDMVAAPCRALAWAVCLAYLLRGYGAELVLSSVLARYGINADCRPQADAARLAAAAGGWFDGRGRGFLVQVTDLPALDAGGSDRDAIPSVLARLKRQPLICGAAGHPTVLTELRTATSAIGRTRIVGATVRDPMAAASTLRPLLAAELAAPFYVLALSIRAL